MTNTITKIRAVLESAKTVAQEFGDFRFEREADEALAALSELERAAAVYLVATGDTYEGAETYTRHDVAPALCDCEKLYAAPAPPNCDPLGFAYEWEHCGNWFPDFSRTRPIDSPHRRNITPLYTTPPPAPVAEMPEWYGMDTPWPLHDVLSKLIEATGVLLDRHSYDDHGHEGVRYAQIAGKEILANIFKERTK